MHMKNISFTIYTATIFHLYKKILGVDEISARFPESLRLQCNGIETEELFRVQIHARIRQRLA